jgi:hypothetical protein
MKRKLSVKNIDSSFCVTVREVKGWLGQFQDSDPIILKCGNKNFRLSSIKTVSAKPVLIGKRGKNDN